MAMVCPVETWQALLPGGVNRIVSFIIADVHGIDSSLQ